MVTPYQFGGEREVPPAKWDMLKDIIHSEIADSIRNLPDSLDRLKFIWQVMEWMTECEEKTKKPIQSCRVKASSGDDILL